MLVPLLVLLPTVRIAYAQPIVKTLPADPYPSGATLNAEVDPNGQDAWWVILMHDEQLGNSWVPVGCTGERSSDAGPHTSMRCHRSNNGPWLRGHDSGVLGTRPHDMS